MRELTAKANPQAKKTYLRHGASEPLFGVRIGELKPQQKKLKGQHKGKHDLALELYATRNSDAMYLAGLIADGSRMTRKQLDSWAAAATWHMISSWSTLGAAVSTVPDEKLPLDTLGGLLDRCARDIHAAPDRVRYAMNNFVIGCGTYVAALGDKAIATARRIGRVEVDMGQTACQVPDAESSIIKSRRAAPVAPKRKSARC